MRVAINNSIESNKATVLQIEGELLGENAFMDVITYFEKHINNWKSKNIILDLSLLKQVNSMGINVFIRLLTKTRVAGGDLILCNLQKEVYNTLRITKLTSVFNIANDLELAINELNQTK